MEAMVYTVVFVATVAVVAMLEEFFPRRRLNAPRGLRWSGNILLNVIDVMAVRALIPVLSVGMAVIVANNGAGLLNLVPLPAAVDFLIAFTIIDASRYLQHYLLHRVPILWRLHIVHHTDQDYDFSTGLRFHPIEALYTVAFDLAVIWLLGAPVLAVLVYEIVKAFWSVFAHANLRLPMRVDRVMRTVFVTPDLHRIHHSAAPGETNSNYSGVTPVWDRLFGTYIDQPARGHEQMTIGLDDYREVSHLRLWNMLIQPFRRNGNSVPAASTKKGAERRLV